MATERRLIGLQLMPLARAYPAIDVRPDAVITPWRSEKNTNWEGAFQSSLLRSLAGQVPGRGDPEWHRLASGLVADAAGRRR